MTATAMIVDMALIEAMVMTDATIGAHVSVKSAVGNARHAGIIIVRAGMATITGAIIDNPDRRRTARGSF